MTLDVLPEPREQFSKGGAKLTAVGEEESAFADVCRYLSRLDIVLVYIGPEEVDLKEVLGRDYDVQKSYHFYGISAEDLERKVMEALDGLDERRDMHAGRRGLLERGIFQHCYCILDREEIESRIERLQSVD